MAEARTINLPGSLADTQQYTLAPGLLQYVQSVYIEVDNTAGGDARPTLTLSEQSGVVIAKKRQGESIPAGGSGSATWALRLTDEAAAAATGGGQLLFDYTLTGDQRSIDTALDGPDAGTLSQDFACLDYVAILRSDKAATGTGYNAQLIVNDDTTLAHYAYNMAEWNAAPAGTWGSGGVQNQLLPFRIPGAATAANYFGGAKGTFEGYSETTSRFRQVQFEAGDLDVSGVTAIGFLDFQYGVWKSTAAIDRLAVRASGALDKLVTDSRFMVWGR